MGKRKRATKKPSTTKKQQKLDTVFTCPICSHEKAVDCTIDRESGIGKVECRVCCVQFESSINKLEEAIDVYSNWIDALEELNTPDSAKASILPSKANININIANGNGEYDGRRSSGARSGILGDDDDDEDDY